jgi:organic radical activating enzyme
MNLILTSICNKKCSFCFADGKGEPNELSLDQISIILDKSSPSEDIKLLGGEPTLYSKFPQLLELCKTKPNTTVLISNFFIYKQEVKDAILDFQKEKSLKFLINVSETTEKQYDLVIGNMKSLIKNDGVASIGFTLDEKRTFDSYKIWLDKFKLDADQYISNIRISVPFPNFKDGDKKNFYLYKNYVFTDLIEEFIRWGLHNEIKVNIDCGFFPCMFRDEEQEKYFHKWVDRLEYGCGGGAFDIFSDNTASLCYPGKDISVDISSHEKLESAFNEILFKKRFCYASKANLPEECLQCSFLFNKCNGPCLGFVKTGG